MLWKCLWAETDPTRPRNIQWHRAVLLTMALALPSFAVQPAIADTVLRRGIVGTPETLDPQKAATASDQSILVDLFEGLVARDASGKLVPAAASSWTISPDGRVYTFTLRADGRWSNGEAVKAADFVASFRRLFDPDTGATENELLQIIQNAATIQEGMAKPDALGVKALDAQTLEITLEEPTPTFLTRLALPVALPVNVASIKKLGADFATTGKIISNGAYRLAAIDANNGYILLKNARFADANSVTVDNVTYRPFETAEACVEAYRANQVQSCADVPADRLAELKTEFGPALRIEPYAGTYFFALNTSRKPLDDVRVRQALSLAIDREALAQTAWSGGMTPASTLVPADLGGAGIAPSAEPLAARRQEAKSLLQQAGYGSKNRPLTLEIRVGTGIAHEQTARLLADQWREIGVDATILTEANSDHFTRLRDGDFQVGRAGWIVDEADPIDLLSLLRSDNARFNYARYQNLDFDRTLDQAAIELDPAKRTDDLAAAEAMIAKDEPVIPLLRYASLSLVSPRVTGWHDNLLNEHPTRYLGLTD